MKKIFLIAIVFLSGCVCMTKRQYHYWKKSNYSLGYLEGLERANNIWLEYGELQGKNKTRNEQHKTAVSLIGKKAADKTNKKLEKDIRKLFDFSDLYLIIPVKERK